VITQSHLLELFIVKLMLTPKLCSASGLNNSPPAHLRRRNAIVPSPDMILRMTTTFGQPTASSASSQEHAQGSRNALVPNHTRQTSGRSERSVVSSGTEHSLWLDPDLEGNL
jgi:hypothetical protein